MAAAPRSRHHEGQPVTQLLVLRHGRTEWNATKRWQGWADIALDDEGKRQAAAAAEVLGMFDAVWASDLQRAVVTASIIAGVLGVGPVMVDPRLRETDVGPWEGLNREEVEADWPGFLAAQRRPEGFESYAAATARALDAFVDIGAKHAGGTVLIIAHGGILRAIRRRLQAPDEPIGNLDGSWFTVRDEVVECGDLVRPLASP